MLAPEAEAWAGRGVPMGPVASRACWGPRICCPRGLSPTAGKGEGGTRKKRKGTTNVHEAPPICQAPFWLVYVYYLTNPHRRFGDNLCYDSHFRKEEIEAQRGRDRTSVWGQDGGPEMLTDFYAESHNNRKAG